MHTFANNILYNSFIQCCTAYIYAESSPTSLRSLLLRMQRFVGVTPDNTKIVRLVDTKVQRQCQKFLEVLGRTTDVCLLSDRNDTIKL